MNKRDENIKDLVRSKYNKIARDSKNNAESCCCGEGNCCDSVDYTMFSDDYTNLDGYHADADLSLGCGIPTEYAGIREGQTVLDLGSGAGNDCFVARAIVGEKGRVIGIDFAQDMLSKANENVAKRGYNNVDFIQCDIENIDLPENMIDVVISNCVLNLVPDKESAFAEVYRVLKGGGHFCVSDVVINGTLPESIKNDAEMYAGCVSGAISIDQYLDYIDKQGFSEVEIVKKKEIELPEQILINYLSPEELEDFKKSGAGIFSITVVGKKTGQ